MGGVRIHRERAKVEDPTSSSDGVYQRVFLPSPFRSHEDQVEMGREESYFIYYASPSLQPSRSGKSQEREDFARHRRAAR